MIRTTLLLCCAALAACDSGGVSTAEAERAAESQVRERLGLGADAKLETQVFVGKPRDGETTVCGTVRPAGGGAAFPPQRFVAATDPARWLVFEQMPDPSAASPMNMFADWETHCAGMEGDNQDEPLAPTERGEER